MPGKELECCFFVGGGLFIYLFFNGAYFSDHEIIELLPHGCFYRIGKLGAQDVEATSLLNLLERFLGEFFNIDMRKTH